MTQEQKNFYSFVSGLAFVILLVSGFGFFIALIALVGPYIPRSWWLLLAPGAIGIAGSLWLGPWAHAKSEEPLDAP